MDDTPSFNHNNRWKAFLPISLVSIITTLDSSVVNVSLPVISKQLGAAIGIVEWVILAYLLAVTSLLMICGRLGDMHGRRSIYQIGIILFTTASALCGFSVNVAMLIASRGLQGIGAALIIGNGPALVGEIFPAKERGKALGLLGTTVAVGLSLGPALGGLITSWWGWRYIFFLNLPLGILTAWLVKRNLRVDTIFNKTKFDFAGGATMAASLFCLLLVFSRGADWGWQNPGVIALMMGTIFFGFLFIRIEQRVHNPILDLSLFSNPTFRSATTAGFFGFASLFTQTFLLPFYLIHLRAFNPAYAGLFMMAVPSVMSVAAPLSGTLSDKIGTKGLCTIGLLLMGTAQFFLATLGINTPQSQIVAVLLLLGLGIGVFNAPNNAELLGSVPKNRMGNAAGMMGLTRSLGMVGGIGISSAIFTGVRTYLLNRAHLSTSFDNPSGDFAFLSGLRWAFLAAVALAFIGMVMVWGRKKRSQESGDRSQ